jgi:hypothetical protein
MVGECRDPRVGNASHQNLRYKTNKRKFKPNTLEFGKKHYKCVSGIRYTFIRRKKSKI